MCTLSSRPDRKAKLRQIYEESLNKNLGKDVDEWSLKMTNGYNKFTHLNSDLITDINKSYIHTLESKENFEERWADELFDIDQYLQRENLVQPETQASQHQIFDNSKNDENIVIENGNLNLMIGVILTEGFDLSKLYKGRLQIFL